MGNRLFTVYTVLYIHTLKYRILEYSTSKDTTYTLLPSRSVLLQIYLNTDHIYCIYSTTQEESLIVVKVFVVPLKVLQHKQVTAT